jgi:tetratricopeptide (TPR) repeat protein
MNRNLSILTTTGLVCTTILLYSIAAIVAQPKVEKSTKNDDEANSIIDEQKPVENKSESPLKIPNEATTSLPLGKHLDPATLYANSKGAVATILTKDALGFDNGQGSGFFIDPSWVKSSGGNSQSKQNVALSLHNKLPKHDTPTDPKVLAYLQNASQQKIKFMLYHAMREDLLTPQELETKFPGRNYQDYYNVRDYFQKNSTIISQIWEQLHTDYLHYLLTNYHVIKYAATAEVRLEDGRSVPVKDVVMERKDLDLALVSCTIWDSPKRIPSLRIGDVWAPTIGEKAYAIGSPKGLEASLSEGVISGKREIAPGISCLQTTAPISPGSSGGPLLNLSGEVIGVVQAFKYGGQNLNIAIPASHLIEFLKGPSNTRELWRGTDITRELYNAYEMADAALLESQKDGRIGISLGEAFGQLQKDKKDDERYVRVLQLLTNTPPSQFGEYEYLLQFTIGLASTRKNSALPLPTINLKRTTLEERYELSRMDKDLQLAKKSFLKSIELKPEFSPSYERLLSCLSKEGRFGEALKIADILVKKVPDCSVVYKRRGDIFTQLQRYLEARKDYKTAAELSPSNPDIYVDIGFTCALLREDAEAIEAYETAIQLKVNRPEWCYYFMGVIYARKEKFEQALVCFKEAKENGYSVEQCNDAIEWCLGQLY